jgi:hypothetical protein
MEQATKFECKSCDHVWEGDSFSTNDCPNCGSEDINSSSGKSGFVEALKKNLKYIAIGFVVIIVLVFLLKGCSKNINDYKIAPKPSCENGYPELVVTDKNGEKVDTKDFLFKIGGNGTFNASNRVVCGYNGIVFLKFKNDDSNSMNSGKVDATQTLCCSSDPAVDCDCSSSITYGGITDKKNSTFEVIVVGCDKLDKITYSMDGVTQQTSPIFSYPNNKVENFKVYIYCDGNLKDQTPIAEINPNFVKGPLPPNGCNPTANAAINNLFADPVKNVNPFYIAFRDPSGTLVANGTTMKIQTFGNMILDDFQVNNTKHSVKSINLTVDDKTCKILTLTIDYK